MASPGVALTPQSTTQQPSQIQHVTKPRSNEELRELKIEIMNLRKGDKKSDYLKGQKLDILQKERARGRTGTFMRDLKEMHIDYSKANRLIKFYRRAQVFFAKQKERDINMAEKWGVEIQDAQEFELALASEEADKQLAALNVLCASEREKITKARKKHEDKPSYFRIGFILADDQKVAFKKAWASLNEDQRTQAILLAVTDAAA